MLNQPNLSGVIAPANAGQSALFLFSPRRMADHFKRPISYNFNQQMLEMVTDRLVSHPTMNTVRSISNDPLARSAIVPSADGFNVRTSAYSDYWSFVLIVDENNPNSALNRLANRCVYFGMCMDEPITQHSTHSATPDQHLNPECPLMITRKIVINRHYNASPTGSTVSDKTLYDKNIVDFQQNLWQDPTVGHVDFHALTPETIVGNTTLGMHDGSGQMTHVIDHGHTLNATKKTAFRAAMETPTHHLSDVLTSVNMAIDMTTGEGMMGEFGEGGSVSGQQSDFMGYAADAFKGANSLDASLFAQTGNLGMSENQYITLSYIQQQYNPKVIPIQSNDNHIDIVPQSTTSVSSLFSSMVCSCVPSYMNQVGLSAISFSFNSSNNDAMVHHIESMTDDTPMLIKQKWEVFYRLMMNDLFQVLVANGGHFDLNVMSSVSSTTNVTLNFLDYEPLPMGAVFQENTVLGGIVSSMVGSSTNLSHNSQQLNNLVSNVGIVFPG